MNLLKTGIASLSIATAPVASHAQQVEKDLEPYVLEHVVEDTLKNPSVRSYKEIYYMDGYAGITQTYSEYNINPDILKNNKNLKPIPFKKPKSTNANKTIVGQKSTFVHDEYGNVSEILNKKNQKVREISRDPKGNLLEYTDISYKNDSKSMEKVYDDDRKIKEARVYHGNGTATVTSFDKFGRAQFESLCNTEFVNGEERVVPDKIWCE